MLKGAIHLYNRSYTIQSVPNVLPVDCKVISKKTETVYAVTRKGKFGNRIVYDLKNPINAYHRYCDIEYIQQHYWLLTGATYKYHN